jgi:Cu(I)/Ag(I) efflux system membrane protein CusA/SilA
MINWLIAWCVRNRVLTLGVVLALALWGGACAVRAPLDALPDLSENQVVLMTEWEGRSPQVVEDQVTYPLVSSLQGLAGIKTVRAASGVGLSMVYVIFQDSVDLYWARTRVLERLSQVRGQLPADVMPELGPDGTGIGHVFWYVLEGDGYDLAEMRAIQDWYLRYQLASVPGVAEVASLGGFVKQYQIELDPRRLAIHNLKVSDVMMAVKRANSEVGGNLIESGGAEYLLRGRGYVRTRQDLERIVLKTGMRGVPITLGSVARVQMGAEPRRGLAEWNGNGEVAGGIVVMRLGENAQVVIDRVKAKLRDIAPTLPKGVRIATAYDRSDLIQATVATLREALTQEIIIVSVVVLLFLMHFRSALVVILTIPTAILLAFIPMYYLGISSNIMSLGGLAIAIGDLVDSGIVMTENAYQALAARQAKGENPAGRDLSELVIGSSQQVGRAIFSSILAIVISFVPVLGLTGQEGKLFSPLALLKTFALLGAALLAITAVPAFITFFLRGRMRDEERIPVVRWSRRLFEPIIRAGLRHRGLTVAVAVVAMLLTVPVGLRIGTEFMPPLDEGSLLFMPLTLPNVSITEAKRLITIQDRLIKATPEVATVLGKVGRAETATDPAPVSMFETLIMLKPRDQWRPGMTKDKLITELDDKLRIPGVANGWTQPIINRINMLSTGVRTDLGVKIFGENLDTLEQLAIQAEALLRTVPGAADVSAERTIGGTYLDLDIDRRAIARYGIAVGDVQDVIETAIGGMTLSQTVEGRRRFPIRIRYSRELRDTVPALRRILVPGMGGAQVPLGQLVDFRITAGPPMISSEDARLRSVVYLNVRERDMGGFVHEAKALLQQKLKLPPGYTLNWSGQYENQERAQARLRILIPLVLLVIVLQLYLTFHSWTSAVLVILSVPFALIGGVLLQAWQGYNFSVAVWVGYIALAGVSVETGIVMMSFLQEAYDEMAASGPMTLERTVEAAQAGASRRLRPVLMTGFMGLFGLLPVMWSEGTGSDVMRPIAAPMVGGLLTSTLMVLVVMPAAFVLLKQIRLRREIGDPHAHP